MQASDGTEQRRLAGAVSADDGVNLARKHLERDLVERLELPVMHDQLADLQQRGPGGRPVRGGSGGHRASPSPSAAAASSVPPASAAVTSVPRKTSRTAGWARTVAGSPSPTNSPPARQISLLTTAVSARTTFSIQITAMPSALTPRTISTSSATSGSVR